MPITPTFRAGDRVTCGDATEVGVVILAVPPLYHPVRHLKRHLPYEPHVNILSHKNRTVILRESESYIVRYPYRGTTCARWPVTSKLRRAT